MAHFCLVNEDNVVVQVIVVDNNDLENLEYPESEKIGQKFISSLGLDEEGHIWLQTSYNNNFRGNYASIGSHYLPELDIFVGPKPLESWILDMSKDLPDWIPPIPKPEPWDDYYWDESTISWKKFDS